MHYDEGMKKALRRWAELEPQRCRYYDGALGESVQLQVGSRWESRNVERDIDDLVQETLDEALRDRDWKYTVTEKKPYEARVLPLGGEGMSVQSPVHAVLEAYNDALGGLLQR